ncbi:family 1 glycosylhydrolase [Herbiconiux ginsengi]|uniref:Beta-glucosidase n=1 Tax=Herbiconiux ginsengi TaxID=381665 RepID=A0A1H3TCF8_9MICO|nr:family 1 glycosylhydrolase [Herbiconiux ginsengi]SDZ47952.1 beta-glucosidase [Herbiconiux ginsengi]
MSHFPSGFLWGASTSPHQTEGNNVNSDWWAREGLIPGMEPSGDADDSYHRFSEDMRLLAEAGLTSYRFGIEWARIEPRPGHISLAELAHYRRMIETARELGITPVVTLHHFSSPRWFAERGGWTSADAPARFAAFTAAAAPILDDVEWVATINEPNMLAMMITMEAAYAKGQKTEWQSPTVEGDSVNQEGVVALLTPDIRYAVPLVDAHHAARDVLRQRTDAKVGWTVANQAFTAAPGGEARLEVVRHEWEDYYLNATAGDDFVGVQSYSSQEVDADGLVPHPPHPDNTLVGSAYRPDALGMAVRHTWARTGLPILVTENGIATDADERRIEYTREALGHLSAAINDGVDVRGYLHWSLLDNYEWGHWGPTFGLIAVDRRTFKRTPKPSLKWLGRIATENTLDR